VCVGYHQTWDTLLASVGDRFAITCVTPVDEEDALRLVSVRLPRVGASLAITCVTVKNNEEDDEDDSEEGTCAMEYEGRKEEKKRECR